MSRGLGRRQRRVLEELAKIAALAVDPPGSPTYHGISGARRLTSWRDVRSFPAYTLRPAPDRRTVDGGGRAEKDDWLDSGYRRAVRDLKRRGYLVTEDDTGYLGRKTTTARFTGDFPTYPALRLAQGTDLLECVLGMTEAVRNHGMTTDLGEKAAEVARWHYLCKEVSGPAGRLHTWPSICSDFETPWHWVYVESLVSGGIMKQLHGDGDTR